MTHYVHIAKSDSLVQDCHFWESISETESFLQATKNACLEFEYW